MAWQTHPSLDFNATTTSVDCGSAAALDNLHDGAMTVEAWIKPAGAGEGGFGRIFDKGFKWAFYTISVTSTIRIHGFIDCATTNGEADSATALTADTWVHVAMTWDDASYTTPRLWINGEESSLVNAVNRNGAIVSDAADVLYRGNRAAGDRTFDGEQGWARISNIVRYTATFETPDRFSPPAVDGNTVLLHPTDEGTGTALADSAGNGAGTISNGSWTTQSQGEYAGVYFVQVASDTTLAGAGCRLPHQRSAFEAKGRKWITFVDFDAASGPFDVYYTSRPIAGGAWETPVAFTTVPRFEASFALHYDDANDALHYVVNTQYTGSTPFHDGAKYRLGTPETDGTITWAAAEQTAIATGNGVGDFSLTTDSNGLVWIGYGTGDTIDGGADGSARCIKNANTDGTWSTASGFPATIKAGVTDDAFAILAPLDDGTMFACVYEWGQDEASIGYTIAADGTVTEDENPLTASNVEANTGAGALVARIEVDSIADGVIHLAYQDSAQNIKYKQRASNGTWSSETTLSDNTRVTAAISSPRISFGQGSYIYITWSQADRFWITQSADGGTTWETPVAVRLTSLESTYEHAMPEHKTSTERLSLTILSGTYRIRHHFLWVENDAGGGGLSIPIAMYHRMRAMGV